MAVFFRYLYARQLLILTDFYKYINKFSKRTKYVLQPSSHHVLSLCFIIVCYIIMCYIIPIRSSHWKTLFSSLQNQGSDRFFILHIFILISFVSGRKSNLKRKHLNETEKETSNWKKKVWRVRWRKENMPTTVKERTTRTRLSSRNSIISVVSCESNLGSSKGLVLPLG